MSIERVRDTLKHRYLTGEQNPVLDSEITGIRRFSAEQCKGLKELGLVIYRSQGRPLEDLEFDPKLGQPLHITSPVPRGLRSVRTEIAIKPGELLVSGSNNQTSEQQGNLIIKKDRQLGKKINGVHLRRPTAPEIVEIALQHFQSTGEHLFGVAESFGYARTSSQTSYYDLVIVGTFNNNNGVFVKTHPDYSKSGEVFASYVVVPDSSSAKSTLENQGRK